MVTAYEKLKVNILPVSKPIITTYTQHAHILSILTYYESTYSWIYSNYIHLYINKDYKHNWGDFYFPATYELRPSDTCKWLISQKIHRNIVESKWGSIINFIIESINLKNYVHTMVNYYYVPLSDRYKRNHLHHDIFVYGYDLEKEILYVSDFFKNGVYSCEIISFSDFKLAFSTYHLTNNPDYLNEMIYLYKFNTEFKYKISINAIASSLKHYLSNNVHEYWDFYNGDDKVNIDFGMEIYSTLKNYIEETSKNDSKLDIRPFYLLYDHKKIMTLRVKYLLEHRYLEDYGYDYIDEFSGIEVKTNITVNIAIKYNMTKNKQLLERMLKMLFEVENKEFEILNLLLEQGLKLKHT